MHRMSADNTKTVHIFYGPSGSGVTTTLYKLLGRSLMSDEPGHSQKFCLLDLNSFSIATTARFAHALGITYHRYKNIHDFELLSRTCEHLYIDLHHSLKDRSDCHNLIKSCSNAGYRISYLFCTDIKYLFLPPDMIQSIHRSLLFRPDYTIVSFVDCILPTLGLRIKAADIDHQFGYRNYFTRDVTGNPELLHILDNLYYLGIEHVDYLSVGESIPDDLVRFSYRIAG